jgi:hypothetical protein
MISLYYRQVLIQFNYLSDTAVNVSKYLSIQKYVLCQNKNYSNNIHNKNLTELKIK